MLDCPPSLDLLTLNALTAADEVLIPIQCEYYALEGLTQLMQSIRMVREELNPGLEVGGVLLTMFDPRTNLAHQVADEVRSFFGESVFHTIVPRNVRLSEAPSFGMPIALYAPKEHRRGGLLGRRGRGPQPWVRGAWAEASPPL